MKIGIAGTGGIGSNVAVHLVRSGVRRLKIVDFDRVDETNLNRQFYFHDQIGRFKVDALAENLRRIAPQAQIEALVLKLAPANMATTFADCDLVVEGFDGQTQKKELLEALAESGPPIVSACGVAGTGLEAIRRRSMGACTIVGDFTTDACDARCHAPKVAAIAALMAHIVLERGDFYD